MALDETPAAQPANDALNTRRMNQPHGDNVESNADVADPNSEFAVEPVQRIKREPSENDMNSKITTTHDVHGGGRPRLVMLHEAGIELKVKMEAGEPVSGVADDAMSVEFDLIPGVTTIGSAEDCDIRLPGLAPHHAEIRRDEVDEYNLVDLTGGDAVVDGGRTPESVPLRNGRRVDLREWSMVYQRAEWADHGSPYGGHSGGEFVGQQVAQDIPRPRGTSPEGGSEPTATDPGEYF